MKWLFENSGAYDITYNIRYKDYYLKQDYIKPGDTIYLSADKEAVEGEAYGSSYVSKKVKVGGIIYYLPKEGVWPFSYSISPYVVISSINGMEYLYPRSRFGLGSLDSVEYLEDMINLIYPYSYGRTLIYIYTDSKQREVVLDAELLAYARNKGYTIYNYKNSNSELYYEAFNNTIIISLLGITAAAIAFMILYNTTVSKMEQDRNRIGILQSLGVTKEQFSRHYLLVGVLVGILTLLIAHLLLLLMLYLTSLGDLGEFSLTFSEHMEDIFTYRLWLYPWTVHIVICIIYFVLTVLIYYMPTRSITDKYPVENIRSLAR
ncbi:MAG: FtsX-like permease family protein [Tissierellia bacterium]|nr:FtsX-like permease family protein [Tissierellia bacterium]